MGLDNTINQQQALAEQLAQKTRGILPSIFTQLTNALGSGQDDRALNIRIADFLRGTAGRTDAFRGELQRSGLGQSHAGLSSLAAIGQGGEFGVARIRAADDDKRFSRRMQALAAALGFFQPNVAFAGQSLQEQARQDALSQQKLGAGLGAAGSIVGGAFGGPFGAVAGNAVGNAVGGNPTNPQTFFHP